jgi:hypothetical protein
MRRVLKAVANDVSVGDLSTLEDEASVEEVVRSYQELKEAEKKTKQGTAIYQLIWRLAKQKVLVYH